MRRLLVVNAGSSSVKLSLLDEAERTLAERELGLADALAGPALRAALEAMQGADAVVHRIVHGGERFADAVAIDPDVEQELRRLSGMAPLHQPRSLAVLDAVSAELAGVPAYACFDTAFHATLPPAARTYALPASWREQLGVRRYGFHGLSHAWVARRVPELLARPATALRIVSCHLGAGASLCAIAGGRSVETTMGFTPLDGLVMATRSGSVDPGALLWLLEGGHAESVEPPCSSAGEIGAALERQSGLLGLAGTADMREVLARAADDGAQGESERLALDVYVHRLCGEVARMAAALGGCDVLVFTGGVGEGAARVRALTAERLAFLGVALDGERNAAAAPSEGGTDRDIASAHAPTRVLVVRAREDLEMARAVRALLAAAR